MKVAVAPATTRQALQGKVGKQGAAAAAARRAPAVLRGRAEHGTVVRWSMPVGRSVFRTPRRARALGPAVSTAQLMTRPSFPLTSM